MNIQILAVEDDPHICAMVQKFLSNAGYSVDTCSNGNTALEQIYNKHYHLVILDIMLPGLNGQDLLKELRKANDTSLCICFNSMETFGHNMQIYIDAVQLTCYS